uniref:Uncharacterized protein n=1 Tax=Glossina austeni TaxID=7395 RepID=A0A1A9VMN8_GLOAU
MNKFRKTILRQYHNNSKKITTIRVIFIPQGRAFTCVSKQEMEAQLFNEHSALTHKRTGSGSWRKGSRRLSAQQRNMPLQSTNSFLAVTAVNNCAGNSSSGNSASSTTTTADKLSTSTGTETKVCDEKNRDCKVTIEAEKTVLAINNE